MASASGGTTRVRSRSGRFFSSTSTQGRAILAARAARGR